MDMNDEQIGERLQALRGPDVSQAALANEMKARGHDKWSQATVWTVEQGRRPLRLTEALSLSEILKFELSDLLQSSEASQQIDRIRQALGDVDRIVGNLERLTLDFEHARTALRDQIASLDLEEVAKWNESDRERLRRLVVESDARMKWRGEDLIGVEGRGDMEEEWLHYLGEDEDDGVDQ